MSHSVGLSLQNQLTEKQTNGNATENCQMLPILSMQPLQHFI